MPREIWLWMIGGGLAALTLAPMLPRGAPAMARGQDTDAVLLEETLEIDIASVTSARVRYFNRTRVLTPRGAADYDAAHIYYRPGVTIKNLSAAVIPPSGKRVRVKKRQIADGAAFASFELYSDSMVRVVQFPGVTPGTTVEYGYEQEIRNLFYLPRGFDLQETIPVRSKTLTVRAPADFPLRLQAHGGRPEYSREESGGMVTHRWVVRDVPALQRDANMPPSVDLVPRVSISPKEILWGKHRVDASNWNGIARFYWDLARDRMAPNEEVARTAARLTADIPDPEGRLRRLFEFTQGKVNYVSISLDIGGWQPHASGEVLRHRYGDCKDKATLLIAMLRSVDLTAFPVLIRTRDVGLLDRDDPRLNFNHAIVAIPGADGYLFLDPTDERTSFGDLPWFDQGVSALVVKDDGVGDLVMTPLVPPERNRRHRTVTATIEASGDLRGSYTIDAWGQREVAFARFVDGKPTEIADDLEDLIAWLCPGAVLKGHEVRPPERPGDPLRVTIQFEVPRFVTRAGATQILSPHLVRFSGLTALAGGSGRARPILFRYISSETAEVRLTLPPGRRLKKLPGDQDLEGPGMISSTQYELARAEGRDVLVVRRSVTVSRREIPASEYPQLRAFASALAEEEARAVTLRGAN